MKKYLLKAEKRNLVGKKVKILRKKGLLPANIYGKNIKSQTVQVNLKEFQKIYSEAGETGLIELVLDSEKKPILIHNVQFSPTDRLPLHADFYQVNLSEKVTSHIPIHFEGESPAVVDKTGVLLVLLDEVEVEAYPADLPECFTVDISLLKEVDQELKIADLQYDKNKIEIKNDPSQIIAKIGPLITEEMKKEAEAEEAAKAAVVPTSQSNLTSSAASGASQDQKLEEKKEEKKG